MKMRKGPQRKDYSFTPEKIFLPGGKKMFDYMSLKISAEGKKVLILGENSLDIAGLFKSVRSESVIVGVRDDETLMLERMRLTDKSVSVRLLAFEATGLPYDAFDIVYAQASLCVRYRDEIFAEVYKLLKPDGYFVFGELTKTEEKTPQFLNDIWSMQEIEPVTGEKLLSLLEAAGFNCKHSANLSGQLTSFYKTGRMLIEEHKRKHGDEIKGPDKKQINIMKHEVNAYLKLGGDRYTGFNCYILKKEQKS